jgi:diguanylate cyclase (GGDEF)-like protein
MANIRRVLIHIFRWLNKQPKPARLGMAALVFALTYYVDWRIGEEISLSAFYIIPPLLLAVVGHPGWALVAALAGGLSHEDVFALWNSLTPTMAWNSAMNFFVYALAVWLGDGLRVLLTAEQEAARHDYLTGLLNRRAFEERAETELIRGRRSNQPLSLLYLDCDDFKRINDSSGHQQGDVLLQLIAESMRNNLRRTDILARLGSDEFVALLPETGESQACAAASKLREGLAKLMSKRGFKCTISAGVAVFAAPPESLHEAMRKADQLLQAAKANGKGTAQVDVFFGEAVDQSFKPSDTSRM